MEATKTKHRSGRPKNHYVDSNGKTHVGLTQMVGGRFKVQATGFRFTEHDEDRAIAKFYRLAGQPTAVRKSVFVPIASGEVDRVAEAIDSLPNSVPFVLSQTDDFEDAIGHYVDESAIFKWLAKKIRSNPDYVATKTGIPELARGVSLVWTARCGWNQMD